MANKKVNRKLEFKIAVLSIIFFAISYFLIKILHYFNNNFEFNFSIYVLMAPLVGGPTILFLLFKKNNKIKETYTNGLLEAILVMTVILILYLTSLYLMVIQFQKSIIYRNITYLHSAFFFIFDLIIFYIYWFTIGKKEVHKGRVMAGSNK